MNTFPAIVQRLAAPFAIDLRTLALFRVCFGLILLTDLVTRAFALTAHYTDAGIWSRADATRVLPEFGFSLHLLGGSTAFQAALFLLAGLLAVLLVVGYRTRLVSILCWLLLASLNHRNHFILQTSDTLMLALLFWALFLPLGARYSVDAALSQLPVSSNTVCSMASAALVLQVLSVYFFGALLKTGDAWTITGDAVYTALHFSTHVSQLGAWMGEALPLALQRGLTWFVWYIELYGPLLVLLPFFTAQLRFIIVPLLMLMHVGFALLLVVGIYPLVSITSLMLLIPGRFWELLGARLATPERLGLKIYFDGPCTFCRKVCVLLRTFFLLGSTPVQPAQEHAEIHKILQEHNSWVVEDFDGQRYVRWAAMIVVLRRSWLLAPVAGLFAMKPLLALGERFYGWVEANRDGLGRLTAVLLPYRSSGTRLPLLLDLAVGGLMLIVLYANIARLQQLELEVPWPFQRLNSALMLTQNWNMFAPEPGRQTKWLFVEGLRTNGDVVDVYNNRFEPPQMEKPSFAANHYHHYRWRKYFSRVNPKDQWPRLAAYYCRLWNGRHPQAPIDRVSGYVLIELTREGVHPVDQLWQSRLNSLGDTGCL